MRAVRVSVTIAAYNNRDIISDCLDSVRLQGRDDIEVVLVDNASTDGTAELVRDRYPEVKLVVNGRNELFCAAQNKAIALSGGEFVLALNSDVTLGPGFVARCMETMEAEPEVGAVSGRLVRADGVTLDTTGLLLGRDRRPVERGYGEPDDGRYGEPGYVFGAGGAAPFYRRAMLEDVSAGGEYFDGRFGMFYEDLDLAWRAHRRGWKAWYNPLAVARHARGATARTVRGPKFLRGYALAALPDTLKARLVANRCMTIIKNDTLREFMRNLPYILLYELKLWGFLVLFSPRALPLVFARLGALVGGAWRQRRAS